uniref:Cytochrome b5 heme-binding domain-containing protein n=1 Tax=Guillardia theta TaxID=55529 RepID=A0A7S4L0X3_GUITH|mmetsp:Transcript_34857/g.109022  ORF Transcript_34857/g.109022 Transcript_34857/m.109022 type:complete len:1161 (+) Transcript_34857:85-3567(+)
MAMKACCGLACLLLVLAVAEAEVSSTKVPTWAVKHEFGCVPSGPVDDAQCDVEAVEKANSQQLHSILSELVNTTYFRLLQINLEGKCKFWTKAVSEAKCNSSATGEAAAGAGEEVEGVKPKGKKQCDLDLSGGGKVGEKKIGFNAPPPGLFGGFMPPITNLVDKTISNDEKKLLDGESKVCDDPALPEYWLDICHKIPTNSTEYVNLQLNPERWTGYNGSHVWNAIYDENCFDKLGSLHEMCYEERVLYRMLSGMHASINIHISEQYYPPVKGKRDKWEPNLDRFMNHYGANPERLKNLHFAFVVLLRALRKAAPYLYNFPFSVGEIAEDKRTSLLVQRLLDSHLLASCSHVFEAFDEQIMFKSDGEESEVQKSLKSQFKGVFHNISEVMDCISCQKCKLHGKLQLLGLGTALKILLIPEQLISTSLSRPELVALFNTLHKFSHAIIAVPRLTTKFYEHQLLYKGDVLDEKVMNQPAPPAQVPSPPSPPAPAPARSGAPTRSSTVSSIPPQESYNLLDLALSAVASQARKGAIDSRTEDAVIDRLLVKDESLLLLAKHYASFNSQRFLEHAARYSKEAALMGSEVRAAVSDAVDAIVIGGGLAGLSAALTLLDRGGSVVVLEKQGHLGGNSAWASSGVNAVDVNDTKSGDSVELFTQDVVKAAGRGDNPLIPVLTEGSVDSLAWLRYRLKEHLNLDLVGQMGGHSKPRTHRPSSGLAGSAIIFAIQKQLEKYLEDGSGRFRLMKWTSATKLITEEDGAAVVGVEYEVVGGKEEKGSKGKLYSRNVIIATGGYASDYTNTSLLKQYRPDLLKYATTNNKGTTGDGHKLAMAIKAKTVDLNDVQVHPTGFHNPADPHNKVKTLCAEILRGEGGILLDRTGKRFADELGTRDYVTGRMLEVDGENLKFALVVNGKGAIKAKKHIELYTRKELLVKFDTLEQLAAWSFWEGKVNQEMLQQTMKKYDEDGAKGIDEWGKKYFHNLPFSGGGPYYAGIVTPVIHYCMGGIAINAHGAVLREDGSVVRGLYAAGEVIGGLHGKNRLGGNALSECVVFGRLLGQSLPIANTEEEEQASLQETKGALPPSPSPASKTISQEELAKHQTKDSCWVSIEGKVYDFTDFLDEHPAGAEAILKYGGKDGTEIFKAIHTDEMLADFQPIGVLAA